MTSLSTAACLKRSAMGDDMCCSCLKLGDLGASGLWGGDGAGDCQPADSSNTACNAVALNFLVLRNRLCVLICSTSLHQDMAATGAQYGSVALHSSCLVCVGVTTL
jgi:hypothetical protein